MIVKLSTFANGKWHKYHFKVSSKPAKRGTLSKTVKRRIFTQQKAQCNYCCKKVQSRPADFDFDHIIPVQYGGPTCRSNMQILCVRCHRRKSSRERGLHEVIAKRPTILVSTVGHGIRISPQDIRTLFVTKSPTIYCLEFGKQEEPKVLGKGSKLPTPMTIFSRRKIDIQDYFKDKLSEEQTASYKKAPRQVFNIILATKPKGVYITRLIQDHLEIHEADAEYVNQLKNIVTQVGFESIWDRETWVPTKDIDSACEELSSIEIKYVRDQSNSSRGKFRHFMDKLLGIRIEINYLRKRGITTCMYRLKSQYPEWDPVPTDEGEYEKPPRTRLVSFSYKGVCIPSDQYRNLHT